jgi:hypothetical protein
VIHTPSTGRARLAANIHGAITETVQSTVVGAASFRFFYPIAMGGSGPYSDVAFRKGTSALHSLKTDLER